jgi:cytidylate kinase
MYRALTLEALRQGIDPGDGRRLAALARVLRFDLGPSGLLVGGRRVGRSIRAPEVSAAVSEVSAHGPVRRELVRRQREMIGSGGVVAEGRDIGTVVCPDADVKVFLTASAAERARRRHEELIGAGVRVGYPKLKRDLERRDALDANRPVSPLRPAADAHLIDSTGMSQRQVVGEVVRLAREKHPRGRRAR